MTRPTQFINSSIHGTLDNYQYLPKLANVSRMRIFFTANSYLPAISGVALSSHSFRRGLEKRKHTVWVFAPNYPGKEKDDPQVMRAHSLFNPFYPPYPLALFIATRKLKRDLKDKNIQVVHTMQPFMIGRFAKKIARALDVPLVFTHHTRYDLYSHYIPLLPRALRERLTIRSVKKFTLQCDHIIAPTLSIKKFIQDQDIKKPITVIPTGLSHSYKSSDSKESLRKKLRLPKDSLIILSVSRISYKDKNHGLLLESYDELRKHIPKSHLVFVGGGPDLEKLRRDVRRRDLEKHVSLPGFYPHKKISDYYSAADIFANPSITETQGMITLEALSAGLPVIATRAPGNQDFITHSINGYLTKNSVPDFAKHLKQLSIDSGLRDKLAAQAQRSAAPYSEDNMVERLIGVYRKVIARR